MSEVFAGIDAGGTKTRCILMNGNGRCISSAIAGPGNWRTYGSAATGNILKAVKTAAEKAGIESCTINAICLGGAGAGTQEAHNILLGALETAYPAASIRIEHDAAIALSGASAAGTGVIVVSGTGALAYGRSPSGATARADGWGYRLGDEGSSYWIGLSGIRTALREADGRLPETELKQRIFAALEAVDPQEVITKVYNEGFKPGNMAALAMVVNDIASESGGHARSIMGRAGRLLAQSAAAVANSLSWSHETGDLKVFTAGGTFTFGGILIEAFDHELDHLLPGASRACPEYAPVVGAAIMAIEIRNGSRPDEGGIDIGDSNVQ